MNEDEIAERILTRDDICFDEIAVIALYILYDKLYPDSPIRRVLGEIRTLYNGKIKDIYRAPNK